MRKTALLFMTLVSGSALVVSFVGCSSKKTEPAATASDGGVGSSTPAKNADLPAPSDVAAAPADAEKTASGLATKVLTKGTGTEHPTANDSVTVHYSGWTTDGKMFDSSVKRGAPTTFPLSNVVKGWTEGIQLMVEGEKRRLWVPVELAYQNKPGRPAGMLVFDIELLHIKPGPKAPADIGTPPKDAVKKGEVFVKRTNEGKGPEIKAASIVRLNFNMWDGSGKLLQSTVQHGRPATIKMDAAPPGFKDGLLGMKQDDKAILWIPKDVVGHIGAADLTGDYIAYDVDIMAVFDVTAPPDVKAVPAGVTKEKDGLAWKVLKPGTGKEHPTKDSTVKVNYTGWTTDGKMVDSSLVRGMPASFSLSGVMPGWTEGLQLMVEGEKRRFWIPAELAYKGKSGPQGMLVFEIELLQIGNKK